MLSTSLTTANISPRKSELTRFTCICCRIKFESTFSQRAHFKTEWHLYNLKRRICSLEPIDLDSFKLIRDSPSDADQEDNGSNFDISSYVELDLNSDLKDNDNDNKDDDDDFDLDDDWEKIDSFDERDCSDDEIEQLLAKMIKSDTCLFCDKESTDIKNNIEHMNDVHGFFIPEDRYVIDLEGLMDYLGFKVGAGSTCLWCDKQFSSLQGVRLHMLSKDHCKIYYDQDKAIGEFKEYYDYTKQEKIPLKSPDQLDLPRKRPIKRLSDRNSKALIRMHSSDLQGLGLIDGASQPTGPSTPREIKKFNSKRAKEFLKIGLAHNNTMRGRIRHQNPI